MPRTRLRHACAALLLVAAGTPVAAVHAAFHPRYRVRASLHDGAPQVDGTVEVTFTNDSPRPLEEAVIFLFPNRFARPDDAVDDTNRQFVYPKLDFDPGSMQVLDAEDAGAPARVLPTSAAGVPDGTLARIPIAPLAPGASRRLTLRFRTVVPERFGSFGGFDGQLTLVGGWYPYLAASATTGSGRCRRRRRSPTSTSSCRPYAARGRAQRPLVARRPRAGRRRRRCRALPLPGRRAALPALGDRRGRHADRATSSVRAPGRAHQRRAGSADVSCSRRLREVLLERPAEAPAAARGDRRRPGAAAPRTSRRRARVTSSSPTACWRCSRPCVRSTSSSSRRRSTPSCCGRSWRRASRRATTPG